MPRDTQLNKPGAMSGMPPAPAHLPADARSVWAATLAVKPAAEWTSADAALLAVYCRAVVDVRRLDGEIAKAGEVYTQPNGTPAVHPLVLVRARREAVLMSAANRLRIAPSARYASKDVARLQRHAARALHAAATLDADPLLAKRSPLQ